MRSKKMKNLTWTRLAGRNAALVLTLASSMAFAGPAPKPTKDRFQEDPTFDGRGRVVREAFVRDRANRIVEVPITVDFSKVMRDSRLAVLGSYLARLDFDTNAVEFLGVKAGTDKNFKYPEATPPELANKFGWAKVVEVNVDTEKPTGVVNVSVARFKELTPGGGDSIHLTFEGLC